MPPADLLAAAAAAFFGRVAGQSRFDLAWSDDETLPSSPAAARFAASEVAWRVELDPRAGAGEALDALARTLAPLRERGSWLLDLPARVPELAARPELADGLPLELAVTLGGPASAPALSPGRALTVVVAPAGDACHLAHDPRRLDGEVLAAQFGTYLASVAEHPTRPLEQIDLLGPEERERILFDWNTTATDYEHEVRVHELFETQAARSSSATNDSPTATSTSAPTASLRACVPSKRARTAWLGSTSSAGSSSSSPCSACSRAAGHTCPSTRPIRPSAWPS